jgi:hypothetical protein
MWETSREEERRKEREALERAKLVGVMEALGKSKDGTFFLRWLCEDVCGCFAPAHALAAEGLLYREGRRSVGMQIFSLVREAGVVAEVCAPIKEES